MKPKNVTTTVMVIPMQCYTPKTHHLLRRLRHIADIATDVVGAIAVIGVLPLLMLPQASRMLQSIIWWMTGWI
jgi:hypothetical protein